MRKCPICKRDFATLPDHKRFAEKLIKQHKGTLLGALLESVPVERHEIKLASKKKAAKK